MFYPERSLPESSSEMPKSDKGRLRQLLEDPEFLPKVRVLEMDLRESNTASLERAFNEALETGGIHQFLDMCQSLVERLSEEEKPVIENFLLAIAAGEIGGGRVTGPDFEELRRRLSSGDFK